MDEMQHLSARRNKHGTPVVHTPQYPGLTVQSALDVRSRFPMLDLEDQIKLVQKFIRNQKKSKGFNFAIPAGVNTQFGVPLSGEARLLLGWAIIQTETAATDLSLDCTIVVNSEVIVNKVDPQFFSNEFTDSEYYFYPRPLSGQDVITYAASGQGNTNNHHVTFYYI